MDKNKTPGYIVNFSNNNYSNTSIVVQFTVFTNEKYLSSLLNTLAENNLNISAYYLNTEDKKVKFVFIVGEDNIQSSSDVNITRSILRQNKFEFEESKVIRLSNLDNFSSLSYHYNKLIKTLTVYNSYIGSNGSIIYETCCPTKTIKVLNELFQ